MAESTLSIGFPELQVEVGRFLGYGSTLANWTASQLAEINSLVQSGVRRVYYPPAVSADTLGYEWSWLRPTKTLFIVAADADYDLPDDFGRPNDAIYFPADQHRSSISIISVGKLLSMRAYASVSGTPKYAAIRYKASDGSVGQRQEILFYPTPDAALTLSYEYEAYSGALTTAYPYPLGGMQLAELYIESCLAVAESRFDDETQGLHSRDYGALLQDAIARDRKRGAHIFGQMGHRESVSVVPRHGDTGSSYPITYKGETY